MSPSEPFWEPLSDSFTAVTNTSRMHHGNNSRQNTTVFRYRDIFWKSIPMRVDWRQTYPVIVIVLHMCT